MDIRRVALKIGVVYETPLEKAKRIPEIVKKIFEGMKDVKLDRVHFESFGDAALYYEIVYFVLSPDYNTHMDRQQEFNFALKEAFEREKIQFACLTQAPYPAKS
jgi:small-conductance mechanosensitive channel